MAEAALENTPVPSRKFTSSIMDGLEGLGILRQIGLMIGLSASVAMGFAIILWIQGEDYRPLYGSLENIDAPEVVRVLESNNINYRIDQSSGALLVASNDVHNARLKLSEAGVQVTSGQGFELLDQEQPLGTSQFMEQTRFRRGLEGELARTISSITAVRSARVHLAIPKSSVFVRDQRRSSASVFIEMYAGRALIPEQVTAIGNLVASSVPEMNINDVTIVDQRGNLLSNFAKDSELDVANKQLDYQRKLEERLGNRVNSILAPMLGEGGFRAEVSADIDFTAIERTQELYNPETAAIRSEQVHEESAGDSKSVGGIPGALSNQPNSANGENNADIKNNQRTTQATRNYELDRTISYTRQQVGKITRLTVAVAVNDRREVSAEGQTSYVQWSEEELARIQQLVSNAVGFDSSRGDVVNVINKRFVEFETVSQEEPAFYETEWFNKYVKLGVSVLIVAILILGVLRPLFKNLTSAPKSSNDGTAITEFNGLEMMDSGGFGDSKVTLSGGDRALLPNPNESYEQQLLAIRGLVAEDSGRVAQVIKQWIAEDE